MLRHSADRLPVSIILGLTLLDFMVFFIVTNVWFLVAWFLVMIVPKGCICAWNHHHQHTMTFKSNALNRVMEFSYALHTGVTTHLWLLHHVLGHHHNYLDQSRDESRWQRKDGSLMGVGEYTLNVALTSYFRGWVVGQRYPKLLRTHLTYTAITLAVVVALVVYKPLAAVFLFVLPMINGLLITAWATYDHHAGLETEDHFEASYNNVDPVFNVLTGNLGYHTAHHYRQGVHWSELPKLHEEIRHQIPEELYIYPWWDDLRRSVTRLLGFSA